MSPDHLHATLRSWGVRPAVDAGRHDDEREITVGAGIPMAGRFEFRPEVRADFSNQIIINGKKNQVTATGAFLAWF
jgi:hypothetical protein